MEKKMAIEVLKGIVSNSQSTSMVSGGEQTGIRTWQISTFLVNGRPVTFTARFPIIVNNGDEIVVAGKASSRGLKCRAYRNITNGTFGDSHGTAIIVVGLICLALGLGFWSALPPDMGSGTGGLFFLFWACVTAPILWYGIQIKRARRLCMNS
jgi:hypothetical protein